jgi:hypothetical protein
MSFPALSFPQKVCGMLRSRCAACSDLTVRHAPITLCDMTDFTVRLAPIYAKSTLNIILDIKV